MAEFLCVSRFAVNRFLERDDIVRDYVKDAHVARIDAAEFRKRFGEWSPNFPLPSFGR